MVDTIRRIAEKHKAALARLAGTGPVCDICHKPLDAPGKPESADCGGTCRRCMAECGDPDCQASMKALGLPFDPL